MSVIKIYDRCLYLIESCVRACYYTRLYLTRREAYLTMLFKSPKPNHRTCMLIRCLSCWWMYMNISPVSPMIECRHSLMVFIWSNVHSRVSPLTAQEYVLINGYLNILKSPNTTIIQRARFDWALGNMSGSLPSWWHDSWIAMKSW